MARRANPFEDDVTLETQPVAAPVTAPVAAAAPAQAETAKPEEKKPVPAVKRGRGRPPGPEKELKPTTLRLHPVDHRLVRDLARNDEIQMNELIYDALQLYCKTRAVHLKHAPGKAKGARKANS